MKLIIDIIGWIGSVEVILAYTLINFQKINSNSFFYRLLNIKGAACLVINTVYYGAYPSTFTNAVWILIAILAVFRIRQQRKS